jgi:Flp pilus assembly pilin Flp
MVGSGRLPNMSIFTKLFGKMVRSIRLTSQKGQTLVEYALILAIISVVAIGVMSQLSHQIAVIFSGINTILDTAQASH